MPRPFSKPEGMYAGRQLELDLLGKPKYPAAFDQAMKDAAPQKGRSYVRREDGMSLIRRFYPEDPTNPKKAFMRELRLAVIEAMNLQGEAMDAVGTYSAIGTPVDVYHGIDGWIEVRWGFPKQDRVRHAVVTLDASLRTEKIEEGHKADIIVPDMPDERSDEFLSAVEQIARKVANMLWERIPEVGVAVPYPEQQAAAK